MFQQQRHGGASTNKHAGSRFLPPVAGPPRLGNTHRRQEEATTVLCRFVPLLLGNKILWAISFIVLINNSKRADSYELLEKSGKKRE